MPIHIGLILKCLRAIAWLLSGTLFVHEQGHCMACCRLVVDMSCHH